MHNATPPNRELYYVSYHPFNRDNLDLFVYARDLRYVWEQWKMFYHDLPEAEVDDWLVVHSTPGPAITQGWHPQSTFTVVGYIHIQTGEIRRYLDVDTRLIPETQKAPQKWILNNGTLVLKGTKIVIEFADGFGYGFVGLWDQKNIHLQIVYDLQGLKHHCEQYCRDLTEMGIEP